MAARAGAPALVQSETEAKEGKVAASSLISGQMTHATVQPSSLPLTKSP